MKWLKFGMDVLGYMGGSWLEFYEGLWIVFRVYLRIKKVYL